jgi:hypothetical protein
MPPDHPPVRCGFDRIFRAVAHFSKAADSRRALRSGEEDVECDATGGSLAGGRALCVGLHAHLVPCITTISFASLFLVRGPRRIDPLRSSSRDGMSTLFNNATFAEAAAAEAT